MEDDDDYDDRPDAAKRLQRARERAGFPSAKAAATRHGWVYDTYAQHENGARGLTRAAKKYARAFKVSEGWLLTGDGELASIDDSAAVSELLSIFRRLPPGAKSVLIEAARLMANQNQTDREPDSEVP